MQTKGMLNRVQHDSLKRKTQVKKRKRDTSVKFSMTNPRHPELPQAVIPNVIRDLEILNTSFCHPKLACPPAAAGGFRGLYSKRLSQVHHSRLFVHTSFSYPSIKGERKHSTYLLVFGALRDITPKNIKRV